MNCHDARGQVGSGHGAGSGVGRASALRFAEEGAKVVVADVDARPGEGDGAADRGGRRHRRRRSSATCPRRADVDATDRGRGRALRATRHHLQQRRRPDAAARVDLRGAHRRRLRPARRDQRARRVPRLQARGPPVQAAGRRRRDPQHRFRRRSRVVGRHASTARPRARCTSSRRRSPSRARRSTSACNAICPAAMPFTNFTDAEGMEAPARTAASRWRNASAPCTRSGGRSPPRTAPRPRCTSCPTGPRTSPACSCPSTAGTSPTMTAAEQTTAELPRPRGAAPAVRPAQQLQRALRWRLHRRPVSRVARAARAGARSTRASCTSSPDTRATRSSRGCRTPTGRTSPRSATRRATPRSATADVFASSPDADGHRRRRASGVVNSMLSMGGTQHRRYRALVQPSFVPAKAQWWIDELDRAARCTLLIDGFVDDGRAELNVDFAAAIPVLTITGSFGVPVEQALIIRAVRSSSDRSEIVRRSSSRSSRRGASSRGRPHQRARRGRVHRRRRRRRTGSPTPRSTRSRCCCSPPAPARRGSRWASPSPRSSQRPDVLDAVRDDRAAAAVGHRRVAAVDAHRPDVLAPRDPRRRVPGCAHPGGLGAAPVPRRRQPRPGPLGTARRVRHHAAPETGARVRQRSARVPRHARRPRGDERRHQRAARPAPEPAPRSRRRTAAATSACTNAAPLRSRWCSR